MPPGGDAASTAPRRCGTGRRVRRKRPRMRSAARSSFRTRCGSGARRRKGLGYAGPDPSARRLRTGRAGALGLIFSERLSYQFSDAAALSRFSGASQKGCRTRISDCSCFPTRASGTRAARTVHAAAVDGFVIYSAARNDPRVEAALARHVPVVTVDQPRDAPTPFIGIDDRAPARSAAEYVRELGTSESACSRSSGRSTRRGRSSST